MPSIPYSWKEITSGLSASNRTTGNNTGKAMITIRQAQFDAFGTAARQRLRDRICHLLAAEVPAAMELSAADLAAFVDDGIGAGLAWGFTWDSTLADYVGLRLQLGPGFDTHPAVRQVFNDGSIQVEGRVAALLDRLVPEQWEQIAGRG